MTDENSSAAGEIAHELLKEKKNRSRLIWAICFLIASAGLGIFWAAYNYTHGYLMKSETKYELTK